MIGFTHVVLHLALCRAVARLPAAADLKVYLRLVDRDNRTMLKQSFVAPRGTDPETIVEFDAPRGVYLMQVGVPAQNCAASDYVLFLSDATRSMNETLADGPPVRTQPMLVAGTAPQSFLYVQPQFVLLAKDTAVCNKPIGELLPMRSVLENDQNSFYMWLYFDPSLLQNGPVQLALSLRMPTGTYHYVRIPTQFPVPWFGWPASIQMNVTQEMVDGLATYPTGVLLCPKIWETSVG
ncbi:MAG: hypothetical protein ACREM8_11450 [Vulcanimicrobiaceae bacterium]